MKKDKPGDAKEDIDADEAARQNTWKGMKPNDGQDSHRTQPIDVGPVCV